MKDGARLAAVIDILELIDESLENGGMPADAIITSYFKSRRYAGSMDRRSVGNRVYAVLRERELLDDALLQLGAEPTARLRLVANMVKNGMGVYHFTESALEGDPHGPDSLSPLEKKCVSGLEKIEWDGLNTAAKENVPQWLVGLLKEKYGDDWHQEAAALRRRASLDIRVNRLKTWRKKAREVMAHDGFQTELTPFSPLGLRMSENKALQNSKAYVSGLIEIQDEAAQIASLLVSVKPGQQVLDICAGGGGKSLAIAGTMDNKGQIFATDINEKRLASFKERAKRADVQTIQIQLLDEAGKERKKWLRRREGKMDRVLADVPCTGTGTWRRNPELRWRHSAEKLLQLTSVQKKLLAEAAQCVRIGGRLLYMTCSMLAEENENIVDDFLSSNAHFKALDWQTVWREVMPDIALPGTAAMNSNYLQLTPARHGCDGFFVAILERID